MNRNKTNRLIAIVLILLFSYGAGTEGIALKNYCRIKGGQASIVSLDVCGHGGQSINPAGPGYAALFRDVNFHFYRAFSGFHTIPDTAFAMTEPEEIDNPPKA